MKSFINSIVQLQNIIDGKLPGEAAQYRMAPLNRVKMADYKTKMSSAKLGAVCINLFEHQDSTYTLLTVRQENLKTHAGQVSFPGGRVETTDNSELAASLREFEEEIGVPATHLKLVGALSPLYIPASNFLVKPFLTFSDNSFTVKPDKNEVKELLFFNVMELLNDSLKGQVRVKLFTGISTLVPCYNIQGNSVWGATAMILSELEDIVRKAFEKQN